MTAARPQLAGAFTLIEVLAAMTFLGLVLPVVVSALMLSNRAALIAERSSTALRLGENRLEELLLDNGWTTAGTSGEFGNDWPGYRWTLQKNSWNDGNATELSLIVQFSVQGRQHDVRISTLATEIFAAP
jgi:type II secretory pathway pseudopilin PulG